LVETVLGSELELAANLRTISIMPATMLRSQPNARQRTFFIRRENLSLKLYRQRIDLRRQIRRAVLEVAA